MISNQTPAALLTSSSPLIESCWRLLQTITTGTDPRQMFRSLKQAPQLRRFASTFASGTAPSNATLAFATVSSLGLVGTYAYLYASPISANSPAENGLHAPTYPWPQSGMMQTYDHQSLRRGYQVYREVCSACHSLDRIAWRNLVGVTHTVDEAKAMCEEVEYEDGPDDNGEMFQRPGKLSDYMPRPYPNDEAARAGLFFSYHVRSFIFADCLI